MYKRIRIFFVENGSILQIIVQVKGSHDVPSSNIFVDSMFLSEIECSRFMSYSLYSKIMKRYMVHAQHG